MLSWANLNSLYYILWFRMLYLQKQKLKSGVIKDKFFGFIFKSNFTFWVTPPFNTAIHSIRREGLLSYITVIGLLEDRERHLWGIFQYRWRRQDITRLGEQRPRNSTAQAWRAVPYYYYYYYIKCWLAGWYGITPLDSVCIEEDGMRLYIKPWILGKI